MILALIKICWELLKIKKIIIISENNNIAGLSVFNRKNLLFLNDDVTRNLLLTRNIFLKDIVIEKKFPSQIMIKTVWRKPIASISTSGEQILIDDEGFPAFPNDNLSYQVPQIFLSKVIFGSRSPDWRLLKSADFIKELNQKDIIISRLTFNENTSEIVALIDDSVMVLIPYNFDPTSISASLQTIISRFRIEGKFITKIDFRFDKPVVVLKNE
ncbi:hypothetical protein A2W14_00235 [Candidatus Gottesmanbacteria bacterium RBG_16_37_8]|uniref:POTRA domain-containing protein n=1 Tax=Candidatus Gottesmanbacteria bacterium RBG_16_37_8 TaxID=1798371 RepID=A0A1F5YSG6_9BACT|nr:MAG: hypothetical protein A2W14_00235 [Candidatus Gottesmanbacteria bacterium RBG_16_37_8]